MLHVCFDTPRFFSICWYFFVRTASDRRASTPADPHLRRHASDRRTSAPAGPPSSATCFWSSSVGACPSPSAQHFWSSSVSHCWSHIFGAMRLIGVGRRLLIIHLRSKFLHETHRRLIDRLLLALIPDWLQAVLQHVHSFRLRLKLVLAFQHSYPEHHMQAVWGH